MFGKAKGGASPTAATHARPRLTPFIYVSLLLVALSQCCGSRSCGASIANHRRDEELSRCEGMQGWCGAGGRRRRPPTHPLGSRISIHVLSCT